MSFLFMKMCTISLITLHVKKVETLSTLAKQFLKPSDLNIKLGPTVLQLLTVN